MINRAKLLEINGLDVSFSSGQETIYAVRDVSITLNPCLLYTSDAADD